MLAVCVGLCTYTEIEYILEDRISHLQVLHVFCDTDYKLQNTNYRITKFCNFFIVPKVGFWFPIHSTKYSLYGFSLSV